MKQNYKKYIEENIGKKSVQEIARDLGVKERKIKKLLEKEKHRKRPQPEVAEMDAGVKRRVILVPVILIIVIGLLIYGNSLSNKFAWDDQLLITNNYYVTNFQPAFIPRILAGSISEGAGARGNFYRPLQIASYVLDRMFYGVKPQGFHFTNFLLHIFTALAFYILIKILFNDRLLAFIAAIIFLAHPVHTEAVTYIAGRADPLSALFILLAIVFLVKYYHRRTSNFLWFSSVSFVLALMSKEAAIMTPFLLLLSYMAMRKQSGYSSRKTLFPFVIYAAIAAGYIILRLTALKFDVSDISAPVIVNPFHFFKTIFLYVKILLVPTGLHMEYPDMTASLSEPSVLLGMLIVAASITALIKIKEFGPLKFGILWFFINIAAVSNIYPLNAYFYEHWAYLPSMGFFLVIAALTAPIIKKRSWPSKALIVLLIIITAFYSFLTVRQNKVWRDSKAVYENALIYNPSSSRLHNNLGLIYAAEGSKKKAMEAYKKALEIDPNNVQACYNIGNLLLGEEKPEEASKYYLKAVDLDPTSSEANYNLGNLYVYLKEYDKAEEQYRRAIRLNPYYVEAHNNLGGIYNLTGRRAQAIEEWEKTIRIKPDFEDARRNLERFGK